MSKSTTNLSDSIAEPSSNISSTIPTEESCLVNLLGWSFAFFLKIRDFNLFIFFGGDRGRIV